MSRVVFEYLNDVNQQIISERQTQLDDIYKIISKLECRLLEKDFIHIQDMYVYIDTNPYLKTQAAKDSAFNRYLDIFKVNHADDLNKAVYCHHNDGNTTTLIQAIDNYMDL